MLNQWEQWLQEKGIALPPDAEKMFAAFYQILVRENEKVNLTRITEEKEAWIKHFIDSLELLTCCPPTGGKLLDVGSGAGMPGIPLQIACPSLSLTLLDASRKRVTFLQEAAVELGLDDVTAIHGRAEDVGRDPRYREQFNLVASRAVARLNVLCELCLPFVTPGGRFVAYKGPEGWKEMEEARRAIGLLGGGSVTVHRYILPEDLGERTLVIIEKAKPTDNKYPRKAGLPGKRPL